MEDFGACIWNSVECRLDYYVGVRECDAWGDLADTYILDVAGGSYAVFETKCSSDVTDPDVKKKIADLLRKAKEAETNAIEILAK